MTGEFAYLHSLLISGKFGEVIIHIMNSLLPYGMLWFLIGIGIFYVVHQASKNLLISSIPFAIYFFVVNGYISNVYAKTISMMVGYILIFVVAYGLYKLIKSE